ncbi:hypothetical protein [Streptomyces sp. NRRL WC-3742]|uniref:hypothetical protein n=1 Tax=Streptomyces sp. NRRL WC-3742 TaxID=1463934 RepID=UPI0004C73E75|nr:hypothetical protein [Streptomyces sp. NRRL WC-3742]
MGDTVLRTHRARLLAVTLGGAIALATPVPAGAEDTEPAVVVNGTFSSPTVPDGQSFAKGVDNWDSPGALASAARAEHRNGYQAASLGWNGKGIAISTKLPGIRRGATVTLTWDDNPDKCVGTSNAKRAYSVTVAGDANTPGAFTSNAPNSKANWFYGRSYSFTAAEDAPKVTFASTDADSPGCGALITNVAAKQTAPPLGSPQSTGSSDPCKDKPDDPGCKTSADNKDKIDKCPPSNRDCLAEVAGTGEKEHAGIDKETQAVENFNKVPRDQEPNAAANDLCALPNALTGSVKPGDAVVPPSQWWFC